MASAKQLLAHLADDTAEALEGLQAQINDLRAQLKEDAFALIVYYEALRLLTADPGNPFVAATAARDVLGFLNTDAPAAPEE